MNEVHIDSFVFVCFKGSYVNKLSLIKLILGLLCDLSLCTL